MTELSMKEIRKLSVPDFGKVVRRTHGKDTFISATLISEKEMPKQPFNADEITVSNWEPMFEVRKKPIIIHATQINFPEGFIVTSKEGKMVGKPGDWLMFGVDGERYICDKKIFEKTYDIIGETKKEG